MNKRTKALTTEQYKEIVATMKQGFCGCRPNERIATALVLEGNLGLRISDIVKLRPCDIVRDGDRYRLEIVEQKTGKHRVFTVPLVIAQYIENYCLRKGIGANDRIFHITERAIQKQLKLVCDYLGFEGMEDATNGKNIIARVSSRSRAQAGDEITVAIDPSRIHIFDKDSEKCIAH